MTGALTVGPITASDAARYAEAACDRNPIHVDADFARSVGLPGPVAHGMWVMGQFERLVREEAAGRRIEAFSVRFTKPVPIGSILSLQSRVAQQAIGEDGIERTTLRLVAFVDRQIVCIGTATWAAARSEPADAPGGAG